MGRGAPGLLSLCFCQACERRSAAAGVDRSHLVQLVRMGVDAESGTIEDCLGDELAAAVVAIRTGVAKELRAMLVARCRSVDPNVRITVHGSDDPWATGSFATLQPAVGEGIDGVVASCWDPAAGGQRISACGRWRVQMVPAPEHVISAEFGALATRQVRSCRPGTPAAAPRPRATPRAPAPRCASTPRRYPRAPTASGRPRRRL